MEKGERPTEILPIHLLFLFLPWAFSFGTFALWITAALKIHENPFWIRGTGLQAMKLSCFRLIISKQSGQHMGVCLHDLGCRARSVPSLEPNINVYALVSNHVCNYFSPRSRTCCQLTPNVNSMWKKPLGVSVELIFAHPAYLSSNVEASRLLSAATGSPNTINIWMFLPHLW